MSHLLTATSRIVTDISTALPATLGRGFRIAADGMAVVSHKVGEHLAIGLLIEQSSRSTFVERLPLHAFRTGMWPVIGVAFIVFYISISHRHSPSTRAR